MSSPAPIDERSAFRRAAVAQTLTDASGRLVAASDAFWELIGWEPSADFTIGMISRDDDRDWTTQYVASLVAGTRDEFRTVKRFVRRDGSEFDASVTIRAIRHEGRCDALVGVMVPVVRRDLERDQHVAKLLAHNAATITLIDGDGNVVETAGRYRRTLDYPPEFWDERSILDILVPDDALRVAALRDEVLAEDGAIVDGDFTVVAADGTHHVLEVSAVNMLNDPDVRGIIITSRNVTAERATAAAVERLRDDAVADAERRSRLIATVSHELRNPLHALAGLAELLASGDDLGETSREMAAMLHRQVLQLARVTDDLLESSRLDVGQIELVIERVDVSAMVGDVADVARRNVLVDERGLHVVVSIDPRRPDHIATDPVRLHQVLSNLVHNAVKFTERGSVGIDVAVDEDMLLIAVSDTGVGIPPDEIERVFGEFESASTAGGDRGAGLGLAIARRLVDALGGRLDVRSEVGVGSTFEVRVPLVGPDLTPTAPPSDASAPDDPHDATAEPVAPPRVLVVEDTPVNQELFVHQLRRLGMEAVVAGSGEDALEMLAVESFDAILMDHQLPGMNGRDTTRRLRELGIVSPVVGITASATAADATACLAAGMDAFLAKPVGLDLLGQTLRPLVAAAPAPDDSPADVAIPDAPVDAPVIDPAVLDVAVLGRLVDELGDVAVVEQLVATFLGELDRRRLGVRDLDVDAAQRQAHTLASTAALLGATGLAEACRRAEADASALTAIDGLAADVDVALRRWLVDSLTKIGES